MRTEPWTCRRGQCTTLGRMVAHATHLVPSKDRTVIRAWKKTIVAVQNHSHRPTLSTCSEQQVMSYIMLAFVCLSSRIALMGGGLKKPWTSHTSQVFAEICRCLRGTRNLSLPTPYWCSQPIMIGSSLRLHPFLWCHGRDAPDSRNERSYITPRAW